MATTRIISMHINKGKSVAQCLTDRTDYAMNPDKTDSGTLITSYGCDRHTADAEFLFSKRQYRILTGREQKNDVIAYQVRQSFKPGEVTPEEANKIGYEFAARFLKGRHAFLVATHIDKQHIHNHIIWNSTTLDCRGKFRDFLGSGRAVARLSDTICLEHHLSVIENPRLGNNSYHKWLGQQAKVSHREALRITIDTALQTRPEDFDALLKLLEKKGYTIQRGKHLAFRHKDFQRSIRLQSLGGGYTEEELRAVLAGTKHHTPRRRPRENLPPKADLLIDIQAKLEAGKGIGYQRWASVFNLKQMARTVLYLQEHNISDYTELAAKAKEASEQVDALRTQIKAAEQRMSEIGALKAHIIQYKKTREVFAGYRESGYSPKYFAEHESDILLHRGAKKAFNERGLTKLPSTKSLQQEYEELIQQKKAAYGEYRRWKEEQRELLIHQENIRRMLEIDGKEKRMERENRGEERE